MKGCVRFCKPALRLNRRPLRIGTAVARYYCAFAGTNRQSLPPAVMGTAGGVSRFPTQPKGATAMANTSQTQSKDAAKGMMDKAREMASDVADKAKDMAGDVADKARDLASSAGDRAEHMTHRAGSG